MNETNSEFPTRREVLASTMAVGSLATAGCLTDSAWGSDERAIRVPDRTRVGHTLRGRLVGFEAHASITLAVVANDSRGRRFKGSWSLETDDQGQATLSHLQTQTEITRSAWYGPEGGRRAADHSPVEMILSRLSPAAPSPSPPSFVMDGQNTVDLSLRARSGFHKLSSASISHQREYLDPRISRRSVDTEGLVGWLYRPSTSEPHRPVLVLHGAFAAVPHRLCRLLATHGYATLALQYFDAPGLPDSLRKIPLEYFDQAIQWLMARNGVREEGIGLVGVSRGVEAALLAAAGYEGRATVIGYSGGGVVGHGVVGVPPRRFVAQPAWTRDGSPVAPADQISILLDSIKKSNQHDCTVDAHTASIRRGVSEDVIDKVVVPVEEIDGPVLLLAGADDQQWPSVPASALPIDRLMRGTHSYPYGLRVYCNAGHIFGIPYADYSGAATSEQNGGTPETNAAAAADSWPLTLSYLTHGFQ